MLERSKRYLHTGTWLVFLILFSKNPFLSLFLFLFVLFFAGGSMAPRKESEPNVSEKTHFKLLDRRVEKNGMKELKHLEAVLKALMKRQAKLQAKVDRPGERKPTMEQLRKVNDQLARFNAWTQQYIETKVADSA